MGQIYRMKLLAGLSLAAISLQSGAAFGAETGSKQDAGVEQSGLDVIIVTARRANENLQDVPVAITAMTGTELSERRVVTGADINLVTPSITFKSTASPQGSSNIQIRGIGTAGVNRSFEGSVGVFVDGVYRSRAGQVLANFLDVESLQVLRGPQGTLFGKNTSAGALLVTSRKPEVGDRDGTYELSIGSLGLRSLRAATSADAGPAAFRLAGLYSENDGYIYSPAADRRLNNHKTWALKGQAAFETAGGTSIRLIADYSQDKGDCCYASVDAINGPTTPIIQSLARANGLAIDEPSRRYRQNLSERADQTIRDRGAVLIVDLPEGPLGSLKSVTGYRIWSTSQLHADADFTPADIFILDETFRSRQFSQEFTLTGERSLGTDTSLDYVIGAYFADERISAKRNFYWGNQAQAYFNALLSALPPGTAYAAPGQFSRELLNGDSRSYALFGQVNLSLGDKFELFGGLRHSWDDKSGGYESEFYRPQLNDAFRVLGSQPAPEFQKEIDQSAFSGTVGLQFRPSSDAMFYASYSRGYKAGGINIDSNGAGGVRDNPAITPGAVPRDPSYAPETIDGYELGAKLNYLDGRARTNVALFHNDIKNHQVAQFLGVQFAVLSAPTAKVNGFEIENSFKLGETLTIEANATHLREARFGVSALLGAPLSGRRFPTAPKWAVQGGITHRLPLNDDLSLQSRAQIRYSSRVFTNTQSNAVQNAVTLINGSIGITSESAGVTLEAWCSNCFDRRYLAVHFNTPLQSGDQNAFVGAPRTFGLSLRGSF